MIQFFYATIATGTIFRRNQVFSREVIEKLWDEFQSKSWNESLYKEHEHKLSNLHDAHPESEKDEYIELFMS